MNYAVLGWDTARVLRKRASGFDKPPPVVLLPSMATVTCDVIALAGILDPPAQVPMIRGGYILLGLESSFSFIITLVCIARLLYVILRGGSLT